MSQEHRIDGKVAVVTGASSGIGAEIARALGAAGANVALVGRSAERLTASAAAVAESGAEALSVSVDLVADDAPATIVDAVIERFGRLDIVVHSAGVYEMASLADTSDEMLDSHWAVNVRAPFRLSRAALPHLGEGSAIVFISSVSGHVGSPDDSAYCLTKGAIEMLVRALASELAPQGIRVNAVAPGWVRTPMNEHMLTPEVEAEVFETTPAGRVGEVGDISPAVVFLASDAAAYIHGMSLRIDGGFAAQ